MERVFQAGPFPVTTNLLSMPVDLPVLDAHRGVGPRAARGRRFPLRRGQGLPCRLRVCASPCVLPRDVRPRACTSRRSSVAGLPRVVSTLGCSK